MKRFTWIGLAVLSGCAVVARATMVSPPGSSRSVNAPDNEVARPGIISYSNEGIGSLREARRKDAYRQMSEACLGQYHIDAEGERVQAGVVVTTPLGNGVMSTSQETHDWYIQFSCVRAG